MSPSEDNLEKQHKNTLPLATGSFGRWEWFASEGARAHHVGMAWIFVAKVRLVYCSVVHCPKKGRKPTATRRRRGRRRRTRRRRTRRRTRRRSTQQQQQQQQQQTTNNKQQTTNNNQQPTTNNNNNIINTNNSNNIINNNSENNNKNNNNAKRERGWSFAVQWVTNLVQMFGCSGSSIPI